VTSPSESTGQTYWTGPFNDSKRYRIDGVKGTLLAFARGGEGAVFRATRNDQDNEPSVALKLLANVAVNEYERIQGRCLAISEVIHTNIMRQRETFIGSAFWTDLPPKDDDFEIIFCVAEWIEGTSLQDAMGNVSLAKKLEWVCQIAGAVRYLHDFRSSLAPNGIIHRDIKPSNVRIRADGQAVLIDFGMSRPNHGSDLTGGAGTFLWMAPEAIGESPTTGPESDVWGIGALAHWAITGIPPRLDDTTNIRRERIAVKCCELGTRTSLTLGKLIASLLEANPQQRPTDLAAWAKGVERIALEQSRYQRVLKVIHRLTTRSVRVPALILSILGITTGAWIFTMNNSHHQSSGSPVDSSSQLHMVRYKIIIPGSTSGDVSEYAGPSSRDPVTGSLSDGSTIYITCQKSGSEVGYPEYTNVWDLLKSGSYVSDFFTTTPTPYNFSPNIPRCTS